ncbi:MAG: glycosyltransferase family 4 protein, partial [Nitrososphaerales archaeon]
LSEATAAELGKLGAKDVRVIPIGPYADPYTITLSRAEARASLGFGEDDVVMSLIGRIEEYKGADSLLMAVGQLPSSSKIKLLLVGVCVDESYREKVSRLVDETQHRTVSRLEWVPDEEIARYFQATDVAVFPFREITNSASLLLAQSFAKPIIIPDLPALRDIPDEAVIRFDGRVESLVDALQSAEHLSDAQYQSMSDAGLRWATRFSWTSIAETTIAAYEEALRG